MPIRLYPIEKRGFESVEYGANNDWLHQPGIMLGTLKLNLRFQKSAAPLSLGTRVPGGRRQHQTEADNS